MVSVLLISKVEKYRSFVIETSPKGFSASKCDVGDWMFLKSWEFFRNCLEFFGKFSGIIWEDFCGRNFLGGFFGRIFLGEIVKVS